MEDDRFELGMDLDAEEEPSYLRRQKRVDVRRSSFNVKNLWRLKWVFAAAAGLLLFGYAGYQVYRFATRDDLFLLRAEQVEISGAHFVTRPQVLDRFSGDMKHSVFSVSLAERRAALEQIPWAERVDVARLWPNRIRVVIRERTPVAFLRASAGLMLVDSAGQLLDRPAQASFSFPVVAGVLEADSTEERRRRMTFYSAVMRELDSSGSYYTQELSEVDVSDPEDARVVVGDTGILLHLGPSGFLARYKTYLAHIQEWRRSVPKIHSVDLRYDRQIVVN